jgi:hypothetical protein
MLVDRVKRLVFAADTGRTGLIQPCGRCNRVCHEKILRADAGTLQKRIEGRLRFHFRNGRNGREWQRTELQKSRFSDFMTPWIKEGTDLQPEFL